MYSVHAMNKAGDTVHLDNNYERLRFALSRGTVYAEQGFKVEIRLDNILIMDIEAKGLSTFDGSEGR